MKCPYHPRPYPTAPFPFQADITKEISTDYGILTNDPTMGYHAAPLRATFIIDPSGTVRSIAVNDEQVGEGCLLYTSPSPRDGLLSRMPSSA